MGFVRVTNPNEVRAVFSVIPAYIRVSSIEGEAKFFHFIGGNGNDGNDAAGKFVRNLDEWKEKKLKERADDSKNENPKYEDKEGKPILPFKNSEGSIVFRYLRGTSNTPGIETHSDKDDEWQHVTPPDEEQPKENGGEDESEDGVMVEYDSESEDGVMVKHDSESEDGVMVENEDKSKVRQNYIGIKNPLSAEEVRRVYTFWQTQD